MIRSIRATFGGYDHAIVAWGDVDDPFVRVQANSKPPGQLQLCRNSSLGHDDSSRGLEADPSTIGNVDRRSAGAKLGGRHERVVDSRSLCDPRRFHNEVIPSLTGRCFSFGADVAARLEEQSLASARLDVVPDLMGPLHERQVLFALGDCETRDATLGVR